MLDKNLIGYSPGARSIHVEAGRLAYFAKVIGETDPVYTSTSAARRSGYPDLLVPPTFLYCLELEAFGSVGTSAMLNLKRSGGLHAAQEFHYHHPAYAGDTLTFDVKVRDVYEKKNGELEFLVKETRVTNQRGTHIADLLCTLVLVKN